MHYPEISHNDPHVQKRNAAMQCELIHIFWGYHTHRLRNGFAFAIGNTTKLDDSIHPRILDTSVAQEGYKLFNLTQSVKSGSNQSPITLIKAGITASMWDSLNHVTGMFPAGRPDEYADFIADTELEKFRTEMDKQGKDQMYFRGSGTIHAGVRVGVNAMNFLNSIQYGLPDDHPFSATDLAFMMSKTNSTRLSLWQME